MLSILASLLLSSPVVLHAEIPPAHRVEAEALLTGLSAAIERRTSEPPAITRHRASEGRAGAMPCASAMRLSLRAESVLFVRFVVDAEGRIAQAIGTLVAGPSHEPEQTVVNLASGPAISLSLDALASALLPYRDRRMARAFEEPKNAVARLDRASDDLDKQPPAVTSFEVTVEFSDESTR